MVGDAIGSGATRFADAASDSWKGMRTGDSKRHGSLTVTVFAIRTGLTSGKECYDIAGVKLSFYKGCHFTRDRETTAPQVENVALMQC